MAQSKDGNKGGGKASTGSVTLMAVGDLILGLPDPESFFTSVAPVLKSADVVMGQGETPYTKSQFRALFTPASAPDPDNMRALTSSGFNVITMASNLMWNYGAPGIEDTITWLRNHDIATVGAGMNLEEARRPAILERKGTKVGILDYNCAGPKETWAYADKPGCAYVQIITSYEVGHSPGGPAIVHSWAEPGSLEAMKKDIRQLRPLCDVLVVCLHKGLLMTPVRLAEYEQPVSYAAIDAGADLIISHHAHMLRGIEFYQGKAIFHGLCDFVMVYPHPPPKPGSLASSRRGYTIPPEAKQTIIAKCVIENGHLSRIGYLPCLKDDQGKPELLKNDERGQEVFQYMAKITREEGLNARYEWFENEVIAHI